MNARLCGLVLVVAALLGAVVSPAHADFSTDLGAKLNPLSPYYNNIPRAAQANDVGKIRSLLSDGYSPNQTDENGGTTGLHVAASSGNLQIIAILYKAGADINQRDNVGSTPLDYAAERGRPEAVKLLLDMKANIDLGNKNGMTPLMFAAKAGDIESVRALLAHGANPNISDYTGRDAVGWALESHRQAVVELIRDAQRKH
jgi:ankyrin repeat protein